jgi:hypothetical protein
MRVPVWPAQRLLKPRALDHPPSSPSGTRPTSHNGPGGRRRTAGHRPPDSERGRDAGLDRAGGKARYDGRTLTPGRAANEAVHRHNTHGLCERHEVEWGDLTGFGSPHDPAQMMSGSRISLRSPGARVWNQCKTPDSGGDSINDVGEHSLSPVVPRSYALPATGHGSGPDSSRVTRGQSDLGSLLVQRRRPS